MKSKTKRPTEAQLRYMIGVYRGESILRPRGDGGLYGDLDVIQRIKDAGWIREAGLGYELTDAGLAAIPMEER